MYAVWCVYGMHHHVHDQAPTEPAVCSRIACIYAPDCWAHTAHLFKHAEVAAARVRVLVQCTGQFQIKFDGSVGSLRTYMPGCMLTATAQTEFSG
jgi:hypothetical protein